MTNIIELQRCARFLARRRGGRGFDGSKFAGGAYEFVQDIDKDTLEVTWALRPGEACAFFDDEHVAYLANYLGLVVLTYEQAIDAANGAIKNPEAPR